MANPEPLLLDEELNIGATKHVILVDLSDTTKFPHRGSSNVTLHRVQGYILGLASADMVVKVGVITAISAGSSSIIWFAKHPKVVADLVVAWADIFKLLPMTPGAAHVKPGDGVVEASNTDFDLGTTHDTPYDTGVTPGVGDIVMSFVRTAGAIDYHIGLEYTA